MAMEQNFLEEQMFTHKNIQLTEMNAVTTDKGRKYRTPEGVDLPSITTVLSILSRDSIAAWRKRVGEEEANRISHRAASRGTKVHAIIEDYLNNKETYRDEYLPDIVASFSDIKHILDTNIGDIYALEAPLYSNHLGVAGRVDCVADYGGKPSIIDFKTSRKRKKAEWVENYFMQEAAYAIMWEERTGIPIVQLVTIIAVDNSEPQVFIEHRDNWVRPLRDTIKRYKDEQESSLFV